MSVLRELVARLGFQVDAQGFKKAESSVDKLKSGLQKLGQVASLAGIGVGIKKIVDLASDANETANVLGEVFGPAGAAQVKEWSATVATEVGRSQYQLQEFAGRLGAMLGPMVQNKGAAQEMSTTLSKLAVDLGSFFNATDEEALIALRAGISGESEPLKRFGVVLQDATLQEFAHAQGINKKISAMNVAEKTDLRYQFILANTATAQGDAARTSGSYANASKALGGAMRDLGTEMGQSVMPTIERGVIFVRDGIRAFRDWAKGTHLLEAAMWVLGAAAVVIGASLIAPFVIPALAAAALILLIDEVLTLFKGGKTVIGDYIDTVFGIGATDEFVRNHKAGVELLAEAWRNLWKDADSEDLQAQIGWFGELELAGERLYNLYARLGTAIADFFYNLPVIGGAATGKQRVLFSSERAAGRGTGAALMTPEQARQQGLAEKAADINAERIATKPGRALTRGVNAPVEEIQFGRAAPSAVGATPTVSAPIGPAAGAGAKGPLTVNTGPMNVVLNMVGGNPEEMRRAMQKTLEAERRKTVAAVAQAGGS
jgi:hypothetical protein